MERKSDDYTNEFNFKFPDHIEYQMASIIFFEVDMLRQLEILKGRFDQIQKYSHISMFKELDKDGDSQVTADDVVSFM